jgi:sugar phosphate isomerase/epimerase
MIWGYAGVFPGEFAIWNGDQTFNKLDFMVDNGFTSTSVALDDLRDEQRRDRIEQIVADNDLQLTIHLPHRFFREGIDDLKARTEPFLEELRQYGPLVNCPIVTFCAGPVHRFMDSPSLTEQMDILAEVCTPLAAGCDELGMPLGIENHGDYYCSDLVELCKRVPHLGIFLDTGNCFLIGEQPIPACRAAAPYTIGTHLKDHIVYPDPRELKFCLTGCPLGAGHVGLREIYMDLIKLAPNPKRLILQWEMIPPKDDSMDAWQCLKQSWDFVKTLPEA